MMIRIFFIYLYQAYQYRIDYSRVNEFGQGGDEDETPTTPATKTKVEELTADGSTAETLGDAVAASTGSETATQSSRKRK